MDIITAKDGTRMYPFYKAVKGYEALLETLKERNLSPRVEDRLICRCLYFTGDPSLVETARALFEKYPDLGFRPYKGACYVHHRDIEVVEFLDDKCGEDVARAINETVKIGVAYRSGRGPEDRHTVSITPQGVLICTCKDFQFNLKAMAVYQGPKQQPCCHILAMALLDNQILKKFMEIDL